MRWVVPTNHLNEISFAPEHTFRGEEDIEFVAYRPFLPGYTWYELNLEM